MLQDKQGPPPVELARLLAMALVLPPAAAPASCGPDADLLSSCSALCRSARHHARPHLGPRCSRARGLHKHRGLLPG